MRYVIIPLLIFGLVFALVPAMAGAATRADQLARIEKSNVIIQEIMNTSDNSIPRDLIQRAQGIAVFPNVVNAAFLVGARYGQGVIVARGVDGTWSAPSFLDMYGGSFGFQAGAQVSDLVLVFMTRRSVEALGRGDFTLGATASVAAGPIGRTGQASTDITLAAEIYSYSKTRGLFAGIALDGAGLQVDTAANFAMYGSPDPLRIRAVKFPAAARRLDCTIAFYSGTSDKTYCS